MFKTDDRDWQKDKEYLPVLQGQSKKSHETTFKDCEKYQNVRITECLPFEERSMCFVCPKKGTVTDGKPSVRSHNVGKSDYAKHTIQPWDIWIEYKLNPWDADIVKRVLRNKKGNTRKLDYEKIIHVCQERIRQIDNK